MKLNALLLTLTFVLAAPLTAYAQGMSSNDQISAQDNAMDELDPFDPNIEQTLQMMDQQYESETGLSSHLSSPTDFNNQLFSSSNGCVRQDCAVWVQVVRSQQKLYLYLQGRLDSSWAVSTGIAGHNTPNFDTHPNGRIYDAYTSTKYPGGDYKGLGNMPYAVFISGGFAIHGTAQSNWSRLGHPASHGCIRSHPDNAYRFNRLVREVGVSNVWITVQP